MVDVNQVVEETLALRSYEQRVTNINVIRALAAGLPQVFADPHQLQQVLLNLVINAEQAMLSAHGHGTLVVRTWHDGANDSVVLEVNDDGPGIPEETRTKIFDPFFTTKEVGKGTGLGLTVAYAIVQEHGGRIWIGSPEGGRRGLVLRGAADRATRPRCARRSRAPRRSRRTCRAARRCCWWRTNRRWRRPSATALADAGFVVDRAGDGEEALARVGGQDATIWSCAI